jgi:hypothetical protein
MDERMGLKNSETKKKNDTTSETMPVLPPSSMPAALSR